ncbi:ACT domain-containing protein [Flagelloscypha sp. PMI_526]|nr:ACT domain-containing protein [Flagelloscypha sp. PMI_526]
MPHLLESREQQPIEENILASLEGSLSSDVFSVTKMDEELSVLRKLNDGLPAEATWGALKIEGPMDVGSTRVIASLTAPLKEAGVPVFVASTRNTDYVLIPLKHFENGVKVLKEGGRKFDAE